MTYYLFRAVTLIRSSQFEAGVAHSLEADHENWNEEEESIRVELKVPRRQPQNGELHHTIRSCEESLCSEVTIYPKYWWYANWCHPPNNVTTIPKPRWSTTTKTDLWLPLHSPSPVRPFGSCKLECRSQRPSRWRRRYDWCQTTWGRCPQCG